MSKPMLQVDGLIAHMREKGIRFHIMSEEDAKAYLHKNNNYFKLTSYRKNYPKFLEGEHIGTYVDLDFAYLVELARIDVEVRHAILALCLDIEHFLKVRLIQAVEKAPNEDGYQIVLDYLVDASSDNFADRMANSSRRTREITNMIKRNQNNPYCGALVSHYGDSMPVWVFVEIISFGELLRFAEFVSRRICWPLPVDIETLDRIRQIRNAAAHNNCILNDMNKGRDANSGKPVLSEPVHITRFVRSAGIGHEATIKKLSNRRISQMVHLLYAFDRIVESENSRKQRLDELHDLMHNRMLRHKDYFTENKLLASTFDFFRKILEKISFPA